MQYPTGKLAEEVNTPLIETFRLHYVHALNRCGRHSALYAHMITSMGMASFDNQCLMKLIMIVTKEPTGQIERSISNGMDI